MKEIVKKDQVYEAEELAKLFKLDIDRYYRNRPYVTYYLFLSILLFALGSALFTNEIDKYGKPELKSILWMAGSAVLLYFHFTERKRIVKRLVARQIKNQKPAAYIINNEGLKEITANSESFYNWNHYTSYLERDGIMILYEDAAFRMFSSKYYTAEEWKQLLEWVQLKIKPVV